MNVSKCMTTDVKGIRTDATVHEAAEQMRSLDVGWLPVVGEDGKLVGVLTDRDIVTRSTAGGHDPKRALVGEVMTQEVYFCHSDQDVSEATQIMQDKQVSRLLVVGENKNLAGVVSLGDLAVRSDQTECCEQALEAVSVPA